MYEDMFGKANAQLSDLLAPSRKLNTLLVDNMERMARFQLDALQHYTELNLKQMRAALSAGEAGSLQEYFDQQREAAGALSQKLSEDARTLAGIGQEFSAELQKLAQDNVRAMGQYASAAQPEKEAGKTSRKHS